MLGYGIQGFSDNATFGVGQNRTDMKVVSNLFGDLANCPIKRHIIFVSGNISARNTAECNVHTARLHNEKHCDILSSLNATQS